MTLYDIPVQRPTAAQRRAALDLLRYSFRTIPERRWAELERGEMMVALLDGAVTAAVCWRSETVRLAGRPVGCVIAGPGATAPHARRHGVLAEAMRTVVRTWHEEGGNPISGLETPVARWHRRNGWGPASVLQRIVCRPADLAVPGPDHVDRRDDPLDRSVRAAIRDVHAAQAARTTGLLDRSDRSWAAVLDAPGTRVALSRDPDGTPSGYVLYQFDDTPDGVALRVREMFALRSSGWRALLRFLSRHFEVDRIVWAAPDGFPISAMVAEPARLETSVHPDKMIRIVDIAALAAVLTLAEPCVPFVVEVVDQLAPWNSGRWRIGQLGADVRIDPAGDEAAGVACPIDVLASLLFGRLTPADAAECGLLQIADQSSYEALCAFAGTLGKAYCPDAW